MHRTTIRIDEHLLVQTKEYAARHRLSVTAVIEDALRALLSRSRNGESRKARPRTLRLPVSKQKGGLLPGVPSLDCYGELLDWMEKDLPIEKRR